MSLLSRDPASYDVFAIQQVYEELYSAFKEQIPTAFYPNSMRIKEGFPAVSGGTITPRGLSFRRNGVKRYVQNSK